MILYNQLHSGLEIMMENNRPWQPGERRTVDDELGRLLLSKTNRVVDVTSDPDENFEIMLKSRRLNIFQRWINSLFNKYVRHKL